MAKENSSTTPAIRKLNENKISYKIHQYEYEEKGGTQQTAEILNVDEHSVIKTLVFSSEKQEFLVLMHGNLEVSTKELARILNMKKIEPTNADKAIKSTGYQFGGTSPFGTKKILPIYVEETISDLEKVYINGGKRGFILEISIDELFKALSFSTSSITKVRVGIKK